MSKIKALILVAFSIVLIFFSYYTAEWSSDFVDPACDGMHGQCPPSFWECSFMGSVSSIQIIFAIGLLLMAVFEFDIFKEGGD